MRRWHRMSHEGRSDRFIADAGFHGGNERIEAD
jgi:hypothetical protein